MSAIESHPLRPFVPAHAQLLLLGSFPPPRERWSLDFFYPIYINDMWRVMGLVWHADRLWFVDEARRTFRIERIVPFLEAQGIALYDTATRVRRLRQNASDKYLEVVAPTDIVAITSQMPQLRAIATTGQRATDTLLAHLQARGIEVSEPPMGGCSPVVVGDRTLLLFRMPSTSRAYPLALQRKAETYAAMFRQLGMLP